MTVYVVFNRDGVMGVFDNYDAACQLEAKILDSDLAECEVQSSYIDRKYTKR